MADDFGQRIAGLHLEGDTIASDDRHIAIFGEKISDNTYMYLALDDNGSVNTNITNTSIAVTGSVTVSGTVAVSGITGDVAVVNGTTPLDVNVTNTNLDVTTNYEYATGTGSGATDVGAMVLAIRDDTLTTLSDPEGDYVPLRVNSTGALWVAGNLTIGANNSIYKPGSANLVKDTIAVVVTETPASVTESFTGVMVSGAGMCQWTLEFGPTATPVTIMEWWTTPSHPTEYIDLPDYLDVTTAQTIRVRGTNREKHGSPSSDFTGYATLIRKA